MMTNDKPLHNMILRKFSAVVLFLALGMVLSFSQETIPNMKSLEKNNELLKPIINNQSIDFEKSNIKDTLKPYIYADTAISENKILTLQGNVIIRISETDNRYHIIKSESSTFESDKNIICAYNGTWETYNSGDTKPLESFSFEELKYDTTSRRGIVKRIDTSIWQYDYNTGKK